MVEFALALPVLLMVVYGLLETGRLLFIYASVVTAARQAARYGSATGDTGNGTTKYYNDCSGIIASARKLEFIQRFSNITVRFDNPGIQNFPGWSCGNPPTGHPVNGDRINVSVTAVFTPIVPLLPFRQFPITSTSNRTLLVGSYIAVEHPGQGYMGSGSQGFVLTKWASTDYYYHVGDAITYHYTIQNTGTTPIDGPFYIADNKFPNSPNSKGWPCTGAPNPLPGPSQVVTCPDLVYTVTAADISAPEITNHARASNDAQSSFSNEAVYTVSFVPQPHITLAKTGEPPTGTLLQAGAIIHYNFTITNDGNMPLKPPYTINDSLLGTNWSCPSPPPDPLGVGATLTCTGQYALKNSDIKASYVTNTASATAMNGTTPITSAAVTVRTAVPLLLLNTVSANPTTYSTVGQVITFTYNFSNRGAKALTGITVHSNYSGTISCPASVGSGGSGTCTMQHTVTQQDLDAGALYDTPTISGTSSSPTETWISNAGEITVQGTQNGAVTITMTPSPSKPTGASFAVGDQITYSFTFRNSGNITLKGPYAITVDDPRFGGATNPVTCTNSGPLLVGASTTCPNVIISLTQDDLDAGSLVTHANGTAFPNLGAATVTPGTATATLITYALPRLSLAKIANPRAFSDAGQTIVYTYGLKNTGGYDLTVTPFILKDDKLGLVNPCPAGTIAVGTMLTCGTLSTTTTDADVNALLVTNTVRVDASSQGTATGGSPPGPVPVSNNPYTLNVPLLRCNSTTLYSTAISDGTNVTWAITNKTGTDLHITGGWMRWNNPVLLNNITVSYPGVSNVTVNATGASILLLPSSGWPVLKYSTGNQTTMTFNFSGTASGIKVYLTFQETFNGLSCTLQSP